MKMDLFQSCGHCWVFQICWHIECSTFTASTSRIWKSSTGIPSPPLALFIVMLSKAHLASHSRMSGSRWMITPSWLPESWRSFLYSSSVYSCHLFLISSASVSSYHFCPLLCSSLHEMFPWHLLIFLKRSLVFPILLFSSISLHWSLRKAFLSLLASLWDSAFKWVYLSFSPLPFDSLLFSAICKASSDNHFAFLHFFFLGMVLITASCTVSQTSIHSSSGTLSGLIPWIYSSSPLYNHKGFDTFFNLSLNLPMKSSWSELQSAPNLVFADCIQLLHLNCRNYNQSDFDIDHRWCPCVESSLMLFEEHVLCVVCCFLEEPEGSLFCLLALVPHCFYLSDTKKNLVSRPQ